MIEFKPDESFQTYLRNKLTSKIKIAGFFELFQESKMMVFDRTIRASVHVCSTVNPDDNLPYQWTLGKTVYSIYLNGLYWCMRLGGACLE